MNEKQAAPNHPMLPIYSAARTLDFISVGLIFIGMLLFAGFFSSTPGSLIVPFCNLLLSWFGTWAAVYSMMMIIGGILLLLMRWVFPHVRMSRAKQIFYTLLFLILLWDGLTLSALYGGEKNGGSLGMTYVRWLTTDYSAEQVSFLLWILLILSFCLLTGGTKWIPMLFRALGGEIKLLFPGPVHKNVPEPVKPDPAAFDWESEYRAKEKSSKKFIEEEKKEEPRVEPQEPAPVSVSFKKIQESIPVLFNKRNPMENTKESEKKVRQPAPKQPAGTDPAVRSNRLPPLNLLDTELGFYGQNTDHSRFIAEIEDAMDELGTPVQVIGCTVGPSVIQYQVIPGSITVPGKESGKSIRVAQIAQAERDLAVRLGVSNLSIQAPVPGESYIGIDIPNPQTMKVRLRSLIESPEFRRMRSPLAVALGRNITGDPVVVDLGSMPHLLVAGTTNSGKSICLRSIAICLAMNNTPEQLRFVIIDPKRVEFYHFNGLPHLLGNVETEFERIIGVLEWAVQEMKSRYELFEKVGARKLETYNKYAENHGMKPLPYIIIIIDEMSDIVKGADKQGEVCIDKLASLARATGMHMMLATQRPDTSVITGKIKTNIPARIALNVASGIDSRVIMDRQGAEKLLGRGDMYFVDPSINVPVRVQGPLLTDNEIDKVVAIWKKLAPKPTAEMSSSPWDEIVESSKQNETSKDEKKLRDAIRLVTKTKIASASHLTRNLNISFPTANRLLSRMEQLGVVGPFIIGKKVREVMWDEAEGEDYIQSLKSGKRDIDDDYDYGDDDAGVY